MRINMLKCITVEEHETLKLYLKFYAERLGKIESVLDMVIDDFSGLLYHLKLNEKAELIYALRDLINLPIEQSVDIVFHYPDEDSPQKEIIENPIEIKNNVVNLFNKKQEK
jgi:hypothetical protein